MLNLQFRALITVQAYRNIAEDSSKRGTLIQVILSITMVKFHLILTCHFYY